MKIFIFTLIIFVTWVNSFAQQVKSAAEFEGQGIAAQLTGDCNEALKYYAEAIKINPKSYIAQSNSGNCYLRLEKPGLALAHLQVAVTLNPSDPLLHYILGVAYSNTAKPDEAINALKEALRLDPKLEPAQLLLSELYTNKGNAYSKVKDNEAALQAYREALKLNTESELIYYNLGVGLREVGNHTEAAAAFKKAIEIKKDFREAVFNLALEYEDLGEQTKFLETIKEALRLDPNNLVVIGKYGAALRNNGKFVEAIEPLKRVSSAHPDDVGDLYLLGNTYLMAQEYDAAIKTLSRVLVLQPGHADARDRLRVASARKNLLPKLDQYKSDAFENPQKPSARIKLADTYYALGMYAEAEVEYLKAVEMEPKNSRLHGTLCVNYAEWNKHEKAVACYQEAIQKDPNHVYYFSLGHSYERLNKADEAIAAYKQSLEKKPTFTVSLYQLATVYIRNRELRNAIDPLRKMLAVEPADEKGNYALGQVYASLGDNDGAMQQYYILQNLNPRLAANLLQQISK